MCLDAVPTNCGCFHVAHFCACCMQIRGLPTLVFVSKDVDKLAIRTEGLLPTDAIRDIIEKEILI